RWSIVMNKLGGVWSSAHSDDGTGDFIGSHSGFAELNIGPKYTFLRNEQTGTIGALGLTFDIPAGDHKVFQDVGDLSMTPYISMAQNLRWGSFGSFNLMGTLGYSFATDNKRTDLFFTSFHVDYDIANA